MAGKGYHFYRQRAKQHQSRKAQEYLQDNKDFVKILYLPKGSPEFKSQKNVGRDRESTMH